MKNIYPLGHALNRDYAADAAAEDNKRQRLRKVLADARQNDIARTCAHYELESDEVSTREQKALTILKGTP